MAASNANKLCRLEDLGNEATVEDFFASRLLKDLGYKDSQIKPKAALDELTLNFGRRKVKWRPDYALLYRGRVRWILEAKGTEEKLDTWVGQCQSYCFELNKVETDNPVQFFLITNGIYTRVYRWDSNQPLVEAQFHQVVDDNAAYKQVRQLLVPAAFSRPPAPPETTAFHVLQRRSVSELNADFAWAHRIIYKRENLSYTAAFMEFVKVIFLKLISDRRCHGLAEKDESDGASLRVPAADVWFSHHWVRQRAAETPNPLNSILFNDLINEFEVQILKGNKKRIFDPEEQLNLSPDTLDLIVDRFQHVDLISIDADLNGRMFETFLNSTLRGKALGQYFTSRSVVKLATGLAQLQATPARIDLVLDGCCGTGGFLIEALAAMWRQIDENKSLANTQREVMRTQVATKSLFGIDVARDPALARIARINMYLHGDGGSSIFQLDALDKKTAPQPNDSAEIQREKDEWRQLLADDPKGLFDVVLTNPPFSKDYSRDHEGESQVLDEYDLAFDASGGARRPLRSLSSMVMFLERYHDVLKPGGRLVTVIDDSILGSATYKELRGWIRQSFLVRAVVSLPGDAFQRSQARVKTSILVLEKRDPEQEQEQPRVFMYYCKSVGIDDAPRQRVLPIDEVNRKAAEREIGVVTRLFKEFINGRPTRKWSVAGSAISDRMDVKACLTKPGRSSRAWKRAGFQVVSLGDLVDSVTITAEPDRVVDTYVDELVTRLRVRYDGFAEIGDEVWSSDSGPGQLKRVRADDIVFSHINALHGAVAVVPAECGGCVVTSEYTICRAKNGIDPLVVWTLVRSPEARADLLVLATGIGRTRIHWSEARQLQLPLPSDELQAKAVNELRKASKAEARAKDLRRQVRETVDTQLRLDGEEALSIIAAFKPPR